MLVNVHFVQVRAVIFQFFIVLQLYKFEIQSNSSRRYRHRAIPQRTLVNLTSNRLQRFESIAGKIN